MESAKPKEKRPSRPPPIILYGFDDINKLSELLGAVAKGEEYTYKIVNKNQLRIHCTEIDIYKEILSTIRKMV